MVCRVSDCVEHIRIQGMPFRIGSDRATWDLYVGWFECRESVSATGDTLLAHMVDGVDGDDGGCLCDGDADRRLLHQF